MVDRMRDDDPGREIDRFVERVERTETMVYGRNASVHSGSTEFVGENSLIVRGSQLVSGLLNVIGRLIVSGLGILEVNGLIDLLGRMRVRGGGGVTVEDGGDIVVDGGAIKAINVEIRDGKVFIANMVLDPEIAGGALTFPNGSRLEADGDNSGARLIAGNAIVNVGAVASMRKGPSAVIVASDSVTVNAAGGGDIDMIGSVHIPGIPTASGTGLPLNTLLVTTSGYLRRSDGT